MSNSKASIILVDDHKLFRSGIRNILDATDQFKVSAECSHGRELLDYLSIHSQPDIVLLDLSMPEMDGYETLAHLYQEFPDLKVVVLTMYESDQVLFQLLQHGVRGFMRKNIERAELLNTLTSVHLYGNYFALETSKKLVSVFKAINNRSQYMYAHVFNHMELSFLKLVCTDMTYKEIAYEMNCSQRTVEKLRENMFVKLDVKSRVGLAMNAVKFGIYSTHDMDA